MGDGTDEGSAAIGDAGQASIAFMPDVIRYKNTHSHLKSSQPEGSYVRDLLCVLNPHLHQCSQAVLGKPHQVPGNPHFVGSPPTLLAQLSPHCWLLLANRTRNARLISTNTLP